MSFKPYKNSNLEVALQRMAEQTKRKVLFTSHVANFQKFNRPFMRMLSDKGYEVHYASMGEEEIHDCDKSFVVPFSRSPFNPSNLKAYRQLKKIIDKENYDIIHTHTPVGSVITRLAAIATRKKGTRVIYTAHGFHFFKGASVLNWIIYYPIERYMARHTDTLIAINLEDYKRASTQFSTDVRFVTGVGIDPKKFDIDMTKKEKTELRKFIGLKDTDLVLLYPAELNKNKNQTMLIKAMKKLTTTHPDIHLLLPGNDSLDGLHRKLISRHKVAENVHLLGYRNDIPQLLKIADISVSASMREGLPVNIMEAMYLGIPVVATDCRGNRDLVSDETSGYIVKLNDSDEFAKRIEVLLTDTETRHRLGVEAKKMATKYSLDIILNEISGIYNAKPHSSDLKKNVKGLFIHDFKYTEYKGHSYGDGQFEYHNLWKKKYLTIFESMTVVARGKHSNNPSDVKSKSRLDGKRVRFVMTDSLSSIRRLLNSSRVNHILRNEINKADVIIVRLPSIQGLIACKLLMKMDKPYLLEVVGSSFDSLWYHDRIKGKLAAWPLHALTRLCVRNAQNVIYVTNDFLQKQYPNNGNTLACSDVAIDKLQSQTLDRRLKKINSYDDATTFKLGLVGSYDVMYKGHDLAIRALSRIPEHIKVELHFLGRGDEKHWAEYATKFKVGKNIFFDPPVDAGAQMFAWLDSLDVLLVPSKTEGMPRVLLEGMSRANVCVATAVGDIPSVLHPDDIVDKSDEIQLSSRLVRLLTNQSLMRQAAIRNFKRASDFTLPELTAKRKEYFHSVLMRDEH